VASYSRLYVEAQIMLVRRLVDADTDTRSLSALIARVVRNREVMTYDRLLANAGDDTSLRAEEGQWWSVWFADPSDPGYISADRLTADQAFLADELAHLVAWADKTVAHLDPTKPERVLLYGEIGEALNTLAAVLNRYRRLFGLGEMDFSMPAFQGDWHEPFRPSLFPLPLSTFAWPDPEGFA
jgi:hypothetical protein